MEAWEPVHVSKHQDPPSRPYSGKITYAWRPLATVACAGDDSSPCLHAGSSLVLPGYGVELAIKNMEYNAADDKAG